MLVNEKTRKIKIVVIIILIETKMKKTKKRVYVAPKSTVYAMQTEQFICGSIHPHKTESTVPDWEEDNEKDFEIEL